MDTIESAITATTKDKDAPASSRHVLFLIDQLCESGGAERALLNTIRWMSLERYRCSIITFKIDHSLEFLRDLPCPVYVYPLGRTYNWNALTVALKIRKFIKSERVEIVHTFFETSDIWGGLVAKLSGCRALISSRRDMGILRSSKHHIAYRFANIMFDRVVTVSEEVRQYYLKVDRLSPNKTITIHNGIELEKIRCETTGTKLRESLGIPQTSPVVVSVGHIRKVKGTDTLIEAAAIVRKKIPSTVFLVVGDFAEPKYCQQLKEHVRQTQLENCVRFLGPSENVISLLHMADCFCLLSRSEGFSNAVIEAMACGLPSVVTRVGGNGEAIDEGLTGFLVAPEHAESAAERLMEILQSPDKARAMGRRARQAVEEKFDARACMHRLMTVYDEILAGRPDSGIA